MRKLIKDFVKIVAKSFEFCEPIYEFGSLQVAGQDKFADLRPLFHEKYYVGCDIRNGPGVDKILDLHNIELPSESVGSVLCLDTLEHVEYPHKAITEVYRILRPEGIVVISSVMNCPIHCFPNDYWRFTPEAFKSLLKPFSSVFVGYAGNNDFPHTVIGIGFKQIKPDMHKFEMLFRAWQAKQRSKIREVAKLILPPIIGRPIAEIFYHIQDPKK